MGRSGVGFKSWSRVHYKALRDLDVSRCVKMDLGATYSYERVQEALKQLFSQAVSTSQNVFSSALRSIDSMLNTLLVCY